MPIERSPCTASAESAGQESGRRLHGSNCQPMTFDRARAAYAASRISSNLKRNAKQFGWLQAPATNFPRNTTEATAPVASFSSPAQPLQLGTSNPGPRCSAVPNRHTSSSGEPSQPSLLSMLRECTTQSEQINPAAPLPQKAVTYRRKACSPNPTSVAPALASALSSIARTDHLRMFDALCGLCFFASKIYR